ncbi:GGDEF domain-containing protein, partial [Acinetobacter baumannii]
EQELAQSERRAARLQAELDETRRQSEQDHLTGLPNRRAFDALFTREMRAAREAGEPLCVAFCDVDNIKRINDAHGHPTGDRVLKLV